MLTGPRLKTVTATYASQTAVTNVVDELVNTRIPREKIYNGGTGPQAEVMVPETGVEELKEILDRYDLTSIS